MKLYLDMRDVRTEDPVKQLKGFVYDAAHDIRCKDTGFKCAI